MKIKTWELEKNYNKYKFYYTEDFSQLAKEIKQIVNISDVVVEGTAEKITDIYSVSGKVSGKLILECSRCLAHYDYYLESDFKETYITKEAASNFGDVEDFILLDSNEIDITNIVEESVVLGMPYIPLCKESCLGLCVTCGVNLNEETCNCKKEIIDPRLADLADWFDKD
ncbi:MAG: DUF177 domain-containing protein [Vulcanibacillus sp.]